MHRACRLAMATSPERLLLVTGAFEEQVLAAVADMPLEVAHNPDWEQGLATSLTVAAKRLPDSDQPVLILGCDQPALEATHLLALLKGAADSAAGFAGTDYVEAVGMPAVVPVAQLWNADLKGDSGLRHVLNVARRDEVVGVVSPGIHDIDTHEDLQHGMESGCIDRDGTG